MNSTRQKLNRIKHVMNWIGLLILFSNSSIHAQSHDHSHDNFTKIGDFQEGEASFTNLPYAEKIVLNNLKFIFELNEKNVISIENTSLKYFGSLGWQLYSELKIDGQLAIYKKEIKIKNNEILISHTGNAEGCMSINCNEIEFTKTKERCKCVEPKIASAETEIKHRVFFSAHE